ncbi:MAG TPA: 1-(5-phosphoribosyl)-5-[(5-phosphoribosylamino)methylideneamino]imidazole-4-carboxamide isomerase [Dehalococcoidia bacterium]
MEIIPAIDIRGGKCVRLVQGDYGRETVFGDDPVAMAERWVALGARRLHVVDLDGAKLGKPVNDAIVARIVATAGVAVQVAGGVRDLDAIARWADAGADRVIVGTAAVENPGMIDDAIAAHGDRVAVSVDARDGRVAVKGWTESTGVSVEAFIRDMAKRGVRRFIYTDISRDGMLQHPDFAHVAPIVEIVAGALACPPDQPIPLIYAGGVTSVDDLVALSDQGIEGAISGTALYDGRIDLREAVRALGIGDDW